MRAGISTPHRSQRNLARLVRSHMPVFVASAGAGTPCVNLSLLIVHLCLNSYLSMCILLKNVTIFILMYNTHGRLLFLWTNFFCLTISMSTPFCTQPGITDCLARANPRNGIYHISCKHALPFCACKRRKQSQAACWRVPGESNRHQRPLQ